MINNLPEMSPQNIKQIYPIVYTEKDIKLLAIPKDKLVKFHEFILAVNKDLIELNHLITIYNQNKNISTLNELINFYQHINTKYPLRLMSFCRDFQEQIHIKLWSALNSHYQALNLKTSTPPIRTTEDLAEHHNASTVSNLIHKMPYEKLQALITIFWNGTNIYEQLASLFDDKTPEHKEFTEFLNTNAISLLSHKGNSRTIKIEKSPSDGGPPVVIRIDPRLGQPKEAEYILRQRGFQNFTQYYGQDRLVTTTHPPHDEQTFIISVAEFCHGGDLLSHAKKARQRHMPPGEIVLSSLSYYQQMATILLNLQSKQYAFPDAKNTNWLIGNFNQLKISDTKSLLFIDEAGDLQLGSKENEWSELLQTSQKIPDEMFTTDIKFRGVSANKLHTYILGRNLYEYLTFNTKPIQYRLPIQQQRVYRSTRSANRSANDYHYDVFYAPGGSALKTLIEKMTDPNPIQRISLEEACHELNQLVSQTTTFQMLNQEITDKINIVKQACRVQLTEILQYNPSSELAVFFEHNIVHSSLQNNLDELDAHLEQYTKIASDLKQQFNEEVTDPKNNSLKTAFQLKQIRRDLLSILNASFINNDTKIRQLMKLNQQNLLYLFIRDIWKENKPKNTVFFKWTEPDTVSTYRELQVISKNHKFTHQEQVFALLHCIQKHINTSNIDLPIDPFTRELKKIFGNIQAPLSHHGHTEAAANSPEIGNPK